MRKNSVYLLLLALAGAACSNGDSPPPRVEVPLDTIRAAAAAATPEMARFLAETIMYESIEPPGPTLLPETEALLDTVLRKGQELGFSARRGAGGRVGILEYGAGTEVVGAMIHLDVVPPGDLAQWEHPPFSGTITDDTVFGRGAQDDKGALIGVLWGAKILIDNGMTFDRQLRIILGCKEETTFEDTAAYFAQEAPPDFGIAPDGPFIVRAEAGYADLIYAFSQLSVTADQEDRDTAVYWDGGTAVNSVPDFSFVVLRSRDPESMRSEVQSLIEQVTAEFTQGSKVPQLAIADYETFVAERDLHDIPPGDVVLYSRGQIAHSSIPSTGRNAIVEVALVGARMTHLTANGFRNAFAFVDERIGLTTDGSGFGLSVEKPIPEAADTTASLDLADTYPADERLDLLINFRVGVANTTQEVFDKSGAAASGYGATTHIFGTTFDAYYYADDHPLLQLGIDSYRAVQGKEPLLLAIAATTYAKAAPHLLSYGPIELAEDGLYVHTANEQIPIAALTRNAVMYAHILQRLIQATTAPVE